MTKQENGLPNEVSYEPAYGARPLGRVVQEHIKKPLADKLLFGELVMGGEVLIDIKKDEIIIINQNKEKPTHKITGKKKTKTIKSHETI